MSLTLGFIFSSFTEIGIVFSDLEYLTAYFVNLVGFFSICLFFGILVKRSAFALGFLLILYFTEGIIHLLLNWLILDNDKVNEIIAFLPLQSISNLLVEPFTRLSIIKNIGTQIGVENIKDYSVHFSNVIIVLVWTAIFMFLSYKIIKKRDL